MISHDGPNALQSIICQAPYIDVAKSHPTPQDAATLWDVFYQRVHIVVKISFDWEMERLRVATMSPDGPGDLVSQDHALIFAIYLITVSSLSEDECSSMLNRPKLALSADFQILCEQALAGSNFLCASDLKTLQASTLYMVSPTSKIRCLEAHRT